MCFIHEYVLQNSLLFFVYVVSFRGVKVLQFCVISLCKVLDENQIKSRQLGMNTHMHLFTSIHNYHNDTICVPTRMYCIVESCVSLLGLGHIYHWTKCIFSGPMSWHHMYTYQDLCPGTISIEPTCLDHMYIHQDSCPWAIYILTRTYVLGPYV